MIFSIGVVGSLVFLTNGLNFREAEEKVILNNNALTAVSDWGYPESNLEVGSHKVRFIKGGSDRNILFIGASHIEQTFPYVNEMNSEFNIYYLTEGGCFLVPSYKPQLDCLNIKNYQSILSDIHFEKIVTSLFLLDAHLPKMKEAREEQLDLRISEFNDFLLFAQKNVKKVFIILGEPKADEFNPILSLRHNLKSNITVEEAKKVYVEHYKSLKHITKSDKVVIIDPIEHLCTDICRVHDENFVFYYKDSEHMRPWYAKKSLGYLEQIFQ